ncbi:MAG TPA: hypothetical protein VIW28_00510 [Gemmatimonadales bacterium]|jgi:hypothetical protein
MSTPRRTLIEDVRENTDPRCDCIHSPLYHGADGSCLKLNVIYGPCPCAATPPATRKAMEAVHQVNQRYAAAGEIAYGRARPEGP